jgi:hypothetical protein
MSKTTVEPSREVEPMSLERDIAGDERDPVIVAAQGPVLDGDHGVAFGSAAPGGPQPHPLQPPRQLIQAGASLGKTADVVSSLAAAGTPLLVVVRNRAAAQSLEKVLRKAGICAVIAPSDDVGPVEHPEEMVRCTRAALSLVVRKAQISRPLVDAELRRIGLPAVSTEAWEAWESVCGAHGVTSLRADLAQFSALARRAQRASRQRARSARRANR